MVGKLVCRKSLFIVLGVFFLIFCADLPAQEFEEGDLIFREGTELMSDMVRTIEGGPYSHVGMLVMGENGWQVLHATPSEMPDRADAVVIDDLAFFIDAARSRRSAVHHVRAEQEQRSRAVEYALGQHGKPFSIGRKDGEGVYCTTLVWEAWKQAGVDLETPFTHLNLPLLAGEYLLPNALRASPKLTEVAFSNVVFADFSGDPEE